MYTLQILDAGQTFLHTLGEQPVSLGASADAQVRLRESGVAPMHARLEPHADGIRLLAEDGAVVVVNGDVVERAVLQLGDRVEIGRAVLIVGRTVPRAASADDVLAGGLSRTAPRRRTSTGSKSSSKFVPLLTAVVVLVVVVLLAMQGDDSGQVRGLIADIEHLRARGQLADARTEAASLRRRWAGAADDRLARLLVVEGAIDATDAAHAALLAQVVDPAGTRKYAAWSTELQRLEAEGSPAQRVAARKVRSRLREMLRRRKEAVQQLASASRKAPGVDASGVVAPDMVASHQASAGMQASAAKQATAPGTVLPAVVYATSVGAGAPVASEDIERLCNSGLYVEALSLVQAGFDQASDEGAVAALRATASSLRDRAEKAMRELLIQAHGLEQEGRLQHAVTLLQLGRHRFPSGKAFDALDEELRRLQDKDIVDLPVASAEPARVQTLAGLRSHMDAVRDAEERGDFVQAAELLRTAAVSVRSRDGEFADRLLGRADEAELLASWNDAVVAVVRGGKVLTALDADGRELQLVRVEGRRLVARSADGDSPLDWSDFDADGMQSLAKQIKASGRDALGLAALLYKQGEAQAAESVLAVLVRADKAMQRDVDRVLARGRGESFGELGYVLRQGVFVSLRQVQLEKISKRLLAKLDAAMRAKDTTVRGQFVAETLASGELEAQALAFAMRTHFGKLRRRIESSSLCRQVESMVAERERLDAARQHAKDLIYDEVRYFYPYRPPAVSGQKYAEYGRVQADVTERVAAVRTVWNRSKLKLRVPKRLREDLARVDWLAAQMAGLGGFREGESVATMLAPIAWARSLEAGKTIGLKDFCLTRAEQVERKHWRRILAYNKAVAGKISVAVKDLLRITNDYRLMFGHRPVAVVETACAGSQGHADEMSSLGYFSHMSPTPGRRTPHDRMRLAGYTFGSSENIAMASGALASHNAWCRSSGHHRNLLLPRHREIGIGANGRYWVQNFGSGLVHKTHPVWATLKVK